MLTGHRRYADLCVVALVDNLAESPELILKYSTPRISLFRHLLTIINNPEALKQFPLGGSIHIGSMARQAALLLDLESFALSEVGEILGIQSRALESLQAQFARESSTARPAKVLVIEDEPLIAWQLESLVQDLGHLLVGVATTQRQAARLMLCHDPDIVLSDVRLADGSTGIDSVSGQLSKRNLSVIFITADPDLFSSGELEEPIFVVAKPFVPAALKIIIGQALYLATRPT